MRNKSRRQRRLFLLRREQTMIADGLGAVAIRGLQGARAPAMVPVIGPLLCDYTVFDYFLPALHRGGCAAAGVATQALWPNITVAFFAGF
jgi:hypothetical protein